ncbi:MAG: hypothetical protein D6689_16635 [Deltaproteobacteria bacterium]|nr:MAG: hypothetical protein D6689_16635 [Deltaproteobacteria bacterium]
MPDAAAERDRLSDLTADELRVLAGLVRLAVRTDGALTDDERDEITHIANEAGGDTFWDLLDEAAEQSPRAILDAASRVTARDAQEMIYGALYELSQRESIDAGELEILDRLAALWNLDIRDVGDDAADVADDDA